MRNKPPTAVVLILLAPLLFEARRATAQDEDPIHNELRALRDEVASALKQMDVEALLRHLHRDVVLTPMNAEVCRGRDAVRAYFDSMMVGPDRVVASVNIDFVVDDLTILYGGDTGVACGSSNELFKLTSGLDFEVHNRWTATVVKEEGKWLLASLHAGTNLFDNPLLTAVKRSAMWTGGFGLLIGLVLGAILALLVRRRRPSAGENE